MTSSSSSLSSPLSSLSLLSSMSYSAVMNATFIPPPPSAIPALSTQHSVFFEGLNIVDDFNLSLTAPSNASQQQQQTGDMINNRFIQASFCALYAAIFILGVFGNVLVCYVVLRNKAMQTVTNLFITNLALSDILLCILAVPFTPSYTFLRKWIFGTVLCHLVPYAQGCSVYISTLTLTAIAIDRFFVIIYPFQQRMRLLACLIIIFIVWAVSLLLTLPYGLYMQVARLNFTGAYQLYCEEDWPSEDYRKIYGSITTTLQFLFPFFIISFCYICVSIRLNDRAKTKPGTKTTKKEEHDRDRKKRTNRMLIAMVAVFGISWLPLNVVNVLNDFYANTGEWKFYNFFFFIAHSIAMSSTCYNPFLYAWLNDNFRKEFKLVLPCFNPSSGRGRFMTGSQRWQPDHTYNGNNETLQESLMTSSFIRSTCPSVSTRESIQLNGLRQTSSGNLILISDIEMPAKQHSPETHVLPSGVLETNFEDPMEPERRPAVLPSTGRIRFEDELTNKTKPDHLIS